MNRRIKYCPSSLALYVISIALVFLFTANTAIAQMNLTPGSDTSSGNYDLALKTVFKEAYDQHVRARVQIRTKYGVENMTGIRSDSTGFTLFHLLPDHGVSGSGWIEVPCRDSEGNLLPQNSSRTCIRTDYSSADTIKVNRFETKIDSSLAGLLTNLWGEMLIRSRYEPISYISTGGITFEYSSSGFGLGNIYGHSRNPNEGTFTGDFAEISLLMREAAKSETKAETDSLVNLIKYNADKLMADLLNRGDHVPERKNSNTTLRGCDPKYREMMNSNYCWQAFLTDEEHPYLIIANQTDRGYRFELAELSDPSEIKRVHIIPMISLQSPFINRDNTFAGWQMYLLEPWDIVDLRTSTLNQYLRVFGFREFTLENDNIHYNENSVIISFDGLLSHRDFRIRLDVDGENAWFPIKSLFSEE